MQGSANKIEVYLESGKKRIFAGAIAWPGWCRSGRDELTALQALFDYKERYASVLSSSSVQFIAPKVVSDFSVVERLKGNASTDFGAPAIAPKSDDEPVDQDALDRLQEILKACWVTFGDTIAAASGKELRSGPRGGGRDLDKMIQHVLDAEQSYLKRIGWKLTEGVKSEISSNPNMIQELVLKDALEPAVRGELPSQGPRGGTRWSARYYARRSAWHVLDHVWEIEDRRS